MTADATTELRALIAPQVERMGYELWGLVCAPDARRGRLCVYIDRAGGVGLDDCAAVSEQLSGLLDVADAMPGPYRLEVSSPGLDRLLLEPAHFRRYRHARVALRLHRALRGRRRLSGVIGAADADGVVVDAAGEEYTVPYCAIAQARLQDAGEGAKQ